MSTVQAHPATLPKPGWQQAVAARVTAFLKAAYEIFTEAQIQAYEARRRYPYPNSRENDAASGRSPAPLSSPRAWGRPTPRGN